jgi:serine protease
MGASQRRLLAAAASLAIAASGFGSVVPAAAAAPTTAVTDEQVAKPTSSPIGTSTVPVETPAAPAPTEAGTPLPTEEPSAPAATTAEKGGTPELVTSGSYTTSGAIGVKYATASAVLGAAISPEFTSQRFGGAYQLFENGTIAYLPQYGAYIVIGGNNSVWQSIGAQDSDLGYPISAEYVPMTGGVMQIFQFGKISWNPATGSRVTKGGIGGAWDNAGGPLGGLGYPTTDEYAPMPGGATQDFQYGQISYSPATGSHVVRGAIGATWILVAGPQGHFGYPTADEINGLTGGGAKQYFQYGEIVWSPGVGTKLISGGIRSAWAAQGSEAGRLGYPTNNEYWVSGGSGQDFQGGRITWHSGSAKIEYASGVHQPAPAPAPVY